VVRLLIIIYNHTENGRGGYISLIVILSKLIFKSVTTTRSRTVGECNVYAAGLALTANSACASPCLDI